MCQYYNICANIDYSYCDLCEGVDHPLESYPGWDCFFEFFFVLSSMHQNVKVL